MQNILNTATIKKVLVTLIGIIFVVIIFYIVSDDKYNSFFAADSKKDSNEKVLDTESKNRIKSPNDNDFAIDREAIIRNLRDSQQDYVPPTENRSKSNLAETEAETEPTPESSTSELMQELDSTAWIPSWDLYNGLSSFYQDPRFDSVSPVLYALNDEGEIYKRKDILDPQFKVYTDQYSIDVIPSIANFDHSQLAEAIGSEEKLKAHVDHIVREVEKNDYDGIDLDYESIKSENKWHYLKMIKILSEELHKRDKKLSVTVLSKWGSDLNYSNLSETRRSQDWEFIATYADEVRIMVYDYSYPYSGVSGPIAPISWVDSVLEYAIDKIPKEKIWLGVHLYSYEWISNGDFSSYTYGRVKEIVQDPDVNSTYDSSIAEGVAEYPCIDDKTSCILYYQTPEGVQTRLELAKRYGIKGVAFWRLGGNDDILE